MTLQDLNAYDYSLQESYPLEDTIICNDASIHIFDNANGGTCTILESSSGWKYQLLNVIKTSIFGIVVRGQIVSSPSSSTHTKIQWKQPVAHGMVAIKMYSRRKLEEVSMGKVKEDPLAEISILQSLLEEESHPNVLSQHECCADEENIYSIMPLLPGSELFDVVVDQGNLSETQAKIVFRQVLQGLQSLHAQGIAHQDISLENILYDIQSQSAVIIDFGLAVQCAAHETHVLNHRAGKLFYMAPEIIQGNMMIDPFASDIWSVGISLLYMLIGFPPIEHASADDVRYQYLRDGRLVELLAHWQLTLSAPVLDILRQMLQIAPQDRSCLTSLLAHPWLQESSSSAMLLSSSHDCHTANTMMSTATASSNNNNCSTTSSTAAEHAHERGVFSFQPHEAQTVDLVKG